jgi:hypothetical protein
MSRGIRIFKIAVLITLIGVLTALFYPFVVPGILAGLLAAPRHEKWIGVLVALLVAIGWRLGSGEWIVRINGSAAVEWPGELTRAAVNWAFGSILVTVGIRMPRYFMNGLKSARTEPGRGVH